jgi:hypothetical protein
MGWDTPDIYYQPEAFGLTTVGEVEWTAPCYDFDLTVVWEDNHGNLYWGSDAGCSCPSPFEDFTSLDNDRLERGTKWELISYLQDRLNGDGWYSTDKEYAEPQVTALIEKLT